MENLLDQQEQMHRQKPVIKRRNPWIAFLLSLAMPGLGHFYNGQWIRAIVLVGLFIALPFICGHFHTAATFLGFLGTALLLGIFRLYTLFNAARHARRRREYVLQPFNRWYFYIAAAMLYTLSGLFYDIRSAAGINTFYVTAEDGLPVIEPGDYVVVDTKAYETAEPDYGDIVAFYRDHRSLNTGREAFLYRVIGRPGDVVSLKNDIPVINGKRCKASLIERGTKGLYSSMPELAAEKILEILPNGRQHLLYRWAEHPHHSGAYMKRVTVPPGSYFVLGDNRDNTTDSRFFGFVSRSAIKGRLAFALWGTEWLRTAVDFGQE